MLNWQLQVQKQNSERRFRLEALAMISSKLGIWRHAIGGNHWVEVDGDKTAILKVYLRGWNSNGNRNEIAASLARSLECVYLVKEGNHSQIMLYYLQTQQSGAENVFCWIHTHTLVLSGSPILIQVLKFMQWWSADHCANSTVTVGGSYSREYWTKGKKKMTSISHVGG